MDDREDLTTYRHINEQPELEKAGIGIRLSSFLIDHIIIVTILVVPLLGFMFRHIQGGFMDILFLFPLVMSGAFLLYSLKDIIKGKSMGKRALGLVVRSRADSSETPSAFQLFIRNILTFIWPVEFIVLLCSSDKTKIGDKIAGTDVYRQSKKIKVSVLVISAVLAFAIFFGSLFLGISSFIKSDASYQTALSYIKTNHEITDLTGDIDGYGFIPSGSLSYSGNSGHAQYKIKVIGQKSTEYIFIVLEKEKNTPWEVTYYRNEH